MKTKLLGLFLAMVVGVALPTGGAEPDQSSDSGPWQNRPAPRQNRADPG